MVDNQFDHGSVVPTNADGTLDLRHWSPRVFFDDQERKMDRVVAKHDARMGLIFEVYLRADGIDDVLRTSLQENKSEEFEFGSSRQRYAFLTVSRQSSSASKSTKMTCVLIRQPLQVEFSEPTCTLSGNILNINPSILFGGVELETRSAKLMLRPSEGAADAYRSATQLNEGVVIAGVFEVRPTSANYNLEDIRSDISKVWRFLRFVTGADVGLGPWLGRTDDGKLSAIQPDAGRHDHLQTTDNWASFHSAECLPKVFDKYQAACEDAETEDALKRAIDFYRASTSARNSAGIETGIVLSQSALELLCDFILQKNAGWTSELTSQARGFHNRLGASSKFIGYKGDVLEYAKSVRKAYKQKKLLNDFHILTNARNTISHAKPDVVLTGPQLLGIWNASMFLVELHLFFLIGYRDKMRDRRMVSGWFGETIPVPLVPTDTSKAI